MRGVDRKIHAQLHKACKIRQTMYFCSLCIERRAAITDLKRHALSYSMHLRQTNTIAVKPETLHQTLHTKTRIISSFIFCHVQFRSALRSLCTSLQQLPIQVTRSYADARDRSCAEIDLQTSCCAGSGDELCIQTFIVRSRDMKAACRRMNVPARASSTMQSPALPRPTLVRLLPRSLKHD
jgi:hypothetical protein